MLLGIHTEGVWWASLMKFYMKYLYGRESKLIYTLSYKNLHFFTLYTMVKVFRTNIYSDNRKYILMMEVESN